MLELVTDDGVTGVGEASPAPWVGGESVDSTRRALEDVVRTVPGHAAESALSRHFPGDPLPPAAACALDTALLDLRARSRNVTVAALLGADDPGGVPVAALISGTSAESVRDAARAAVAAGHRTLKLKVGTTEPGIDRERIHAALEGGRGVRVRLRLDANRRWSPERAAATLRGLPSDAIEFVEEPLQRPDPGGLARLRERTGLPLALDESVTGMEDMERWASSIDVVVLKACRCAGPSATLALARRALEKGVGVVVTDSIETSVGASLVVHLAAALPAPRRAVGLGGPRLLAGDVVRDRLVPRPELRPRGPGLGVVLDYERSSPSRTEGSGPRRSRRSTKEKTHRMTRNQDAGPR